MKFYEFNMAFPGYFQPHIFIIEIIVYLFFEFLDISERFKVY